MVTAQIIAPEIVRLDLAGMDKWTAIEELVDSIAASGVVLDRQQVLAAVVAREQQGSTGIGKGIAVPHARTASVGELVIALGISIEGIDFAAADDMACNLIFLVLAPPEEPRRYLIALSELAAFGNDADAVTELITTTTHEEAVSVLARFCRRSIA